MISRVCEEFQCLPSDAVRELDQCEDLVFDILEIRSFANTKRACDDADNSDGNIQPPKGSMADLVYEIEYDLHKARVARMTSTDGE